MLVETLDDNEAAENAVADKRHADSETLNAEVILDAQLENKVETTVELETLKHEETNSGEEGGEKAISNDGENTTVSKRNGDYVMDLYQNTSDEDEEDDLWEYDDDDDNDSEEDDEEIATDEDEVSEEERTVGEDDVDNSEGGDGETDIDKDKVSEKETIEEDDDGEENLETQIAKGDVGEAEELNVEKVEINMKKVKKSTGKREEINVKEESSKKLAVGDTLKSSSRQKGKKRVESMGMIFMCSSKTKNDCFRYKVLGLPESKKNIVEKIYPGMRLFLYDVDLKLMYGIYKADGSGGYNIEPKAFKSKFPSQVRFTVLADCLPLAEEKFKKVIKENYFTKNKFDCKLKSEQVKNLCMLFKSTSKGKQPKKLPRRRKAEKQSISIPGETSRKRRADDKRRGPTSREKIRYVERKHKRPRSRLPPPAPLPSSIPLIAIDRTIDVDPYRWDPYLESRDHVPYRRVPYESRRDHPIERRGPYHDRLDLYRDERDPYLERRDPYPNRRGSYSDVRDSYPDRRVRYHNPDPYPDVRDPYIERRMYKEDPQTEAYSSYKQGPVSEGQDVHREDRGGVVYRDSYRLGEMLDRPLASRYDVVSQDPYVSSSYRAIPSNAEPLYLADYPSRSGLVRQYRL